MNLEFLGGVSVDRVCKMQAALDVLQGSSEVYLHYSGSGADFLSKFRAVAVLAEDLIGVRVSPYVPLTGLLNLQVYPAHNVLIKDMADAVPPGHAAKRISTLMWGAPAQKWVSIKDYPDYPGLFHRYLTLTHDLRG